MAAIERTEVAVVGGGPAGALLAARLARAGHDVVVLERAPAWHWRAGGVFASPASVAALRRAGLAAPVLAAVTRPIPAMRVETQAGTTFRLTYGADAGGEPAVGFDRSSLDPALLELARAAGAQVRTGWAVADVDPERRPARSPRSGRAGRDRGGRRRRRGRAAVRGRAGGRRRPPGPSRAAPRADVPPRRSRAAGRARRPDAHRPRRLRRDRARAGRPGERRDRARPLVAGRGRPRWRPGRRGPARRGASRPPTTTPRRGGTARRSTPSRGRGRSAIGCRAGPADAGSSSATRRGSWIRSPGRDSIGRWSRPSWPPRPSARGRAVGATPSVPTSGR